MTSVDTAQPLLEFIKKYESRGNYDIVWGGIKGRHHPSKPLTQMTIGEVLAWQDSVDAYYMSEAAGAYQILEDTLRGLYRDAGLTLNSMYNRENQDKLALALLRRRGYDEFYAGRIKDEVFANNLAKEWASLPVVTNVVRREGKKVWTVQKGASYYAGDGLNKAHAEVAPFLTAVNASKRITLPSKPPPQGRGFWQALAAMLSSLFRRST